MVSAGIQRRCPRITKNDGSIPTWAFGTDKSNQTLDAAHRTKAAERCLSSSPADTTYLYCFCQHPTSDIGQKSPDFPIYFSVKRCSDSDIRVSLNLFYQKDGYTLGWLKDTGHDWYV